MASKYEKMNLLKNLPFYGEETKSLKKISGLRLLSELPFCIKTLKN